MCSTVVEHLGHIGTQVTKEDGGKEGMDETRPEVGEITPSLAGHKKEMGYYLLFGERARVSEVQSLGAALLVLCGVIYLYFYCPVYKELRFAWSHPASCWVPQFGLIKFGLIKKESKERKKKSKCNSTLWSLAVEP